MVLTTGSNKHSLTRLDMISSIKNYWPLNQYPSYVLAYGTVTPSEVSVESLSLRQTKYKPPFVRCEFTLHQLRTLNIQVKKGDLQPCSWIIIIEERWPKHLSLLSNYQF